MNDKRICGAKNRKGLPCGRAPMKNGRCNLHGGKSPGAKRGNQNALKHGLYTAEMKEMRRLVRQASRDARDVRNAVRNID